MEALNTRTLCETGPSTAEAYRQKWPHEKHWELPKNFPEDSPRRSTSRSLA